MKIVVHLLNGDTDNHESPQDDLDVVVKDGILSIIWHAYQGRELRRTEYPLTSIRNWEYTR